MIYCLCAAHREVDCTNYHELSQYNINMQALGLEPFGPTRKIEAASEEEAKYFFLQEYSKDFDLIECFDGGACLLWKSDC